MRSREVHNTELFNISPDAIFLVGIEGEEAGTILDANHAAATIHGYTRQELVGMKIAKLVTAECGIAIEQRLAKVESEGSVGFEINHLRKDGTCLAMEVVAGAVKIDGRPRVLSFHRNVTDQKRAEKELRESEQRWKFAIEGSGAGLWDCDILAKKSYFSKRWKEMLGYEESEISDDVSEWESRVHPEDWPRVLDAVQQHIAGKTPTCVVEYRVVCKDGSMKWILDRGLVVSRDEQGNALRMIGTYNDISEQRNAAQKLQESEERYRTLVEWTSEAVLVHRDNRLLYVNPAAIQLFGATDVEQLLQVPALNLYASDIQDRLEQLHRSVIEGADEPIAEYRLVSLLGNEFEGEVRSSLIGFDGSPAIHTSIRDITSRKNNERAVRESEARLKYALDATRDGLWEWNVLTGECVWSPQWARLNGLTLEETSSRVEFFFTLLHPEDLLRVSKALDDHFAGKTDVKQVEIRLRHKSGEYRWYLDRGKVVAWDESGQPTRMIGTITDITELRESQLRAESANRAKSEFLANMSHEIRTPLTAILGFTDLLHDEDAAISKDQISATVATIKNAGAHLLTIINDILDLSKIEAEKMTVESVETSLTKMLGEVVSLIRPRAIGKGVGLMTVFATPVPEYIMTDPTRVRQILMNLMGNAIKFTEEGRVELKVFVDELESPSWLLIDIDDTGLGMTEDQINRLFTAFGQADGTVSRKHGGTGLGLTISRRLAQLLGGDVVLLRSELGKGSCFRLKLPLLAVSNQSTINTLEVVDSGSDSKLAIPAPLLSGRILLAEDGVDNQRLIAFHLRKAGANVAIADNGRIALNMVEQAELIGNPYDLLLTDIQMPEMDGYSLTRELRERGWRLPIIALTAHAMAEDKKRCLDAGCDDYHSKPIDKAVLLATCAKWLNTQTRL